MSMDWMGKLIHDKVLAEDLGIYVIRKSLTIHWCRMGIWQITRPIDNKSALGQVMAYQAITWSRGDLLLTGPSLIKLPGDIWLHSKIKYWTHTVINALSNHWLTLYTILNALCVNTCVMCQWRIVHKVNKVVHWTLFYSVCLIISSG